MSQRNIFIIIVAFLILATLPVNAEKWENFGLDLGIYIDMDSITDMGDKVSAAYKYTNKGILKRFSILDQNKHNLSVCYMKTTVGCPEGNGLTGRILCYDYLDNIVINVPSIDISNNKPDPYFCKYIREGKKLTK